MKWLWEGLILEVTLNTDNILTIFNMGVVLFTGVLTALITIVVSHFFGVKSIKKDLGVGDNEAPLTAQHSTMQDMIKKDLGVGDNEAPLTIQHRTMQDMLMGQHNEIRQSLSTLDQKTQHISETLLEEKTKQANWHNNLSESQKELKSSADKIGQFAIEFSQLASEVAELRKENEKLRIENAKLEERCSALIGRVLNQTNVNDSDWEIE